MVTFGTDLRQCSISFFLYHSFYSVYFPIDLNGKMLIGENKSHDYSATVLVEIHITSCLNANVSHTTLTYRHITKHIWHYKPNYVYFTAKKNYLAVRLFVRVVWLPFNHFDWRGAAVGANWLNTPLVTWESAFEQSHCIFWQKCTSLVLLVVASQ